MHKKYALISCATVAFFISFASIKNFPKKFEEKKETLNDWFYQQRTFPFEEINYTAYGEAIRQKIVLQSQSKNNSAAWEFAGPVNIGGRVTDVEMPQNDFNTIYVGAASGGIFKSTDFGEQWTPIFDNALSLSIGDIAISPSNNNTIYVGTGEPNGGSGSLTYGGFGIYKSTNAGESWNHLGLDSTRFIGRIALDPTDSQKIFVAAMGSMFANSTQRGVFRTTNSGQSWENVLFISDSTGCIDVAVNPVSPNIIYAAMWERVRHPWGRTYGGMTSGIYRSTDAGSSWSQLTNGLPQNSTANGRITLALSPSHPNIIYTSFASASGPSLGVYKTTDGGNNWVNLNFAPSSSYEWWFQGVSVHPINPQTVYYLGLGTEMSINGGQLWTSFGEFHVDHHALFIHPQNTSLQLEGNDGGLYYSQNNGANWTHFDNLPITQFYTCEVDFQHPTNLYGGTQDNGTNRTTTGNLDDWENIFGGDGFYVLVDPNNSETLYMESQYGGFSFGTNGINFSDRFNWSTPFVFNPQNSSSLFLGSNKLYKTTDQTNNWNVISGDLTNGPSPGNLTFGTITTIAVAPSDSDVVYVGTDDANVWVTQNCGASWMKISDSLPHRWITRLAIDNFNPQIAYVTISGYRWNEPLPHIFRTTNAGSSWNAINGNLPEAPVNDVIIDAEKDSTLFVATDVGVFFTENLGRNWQATGNNFPNVVVNDLKLHNPTRTLVAATYGRSMYKINIDSVTSVKETATQISRFILEQNYPNPFNPVTIIKFTVPDETKEQSAMQATLKIYDILGKEITTLMNNEEIHAGGNYAFQFDAGNITSGVYLYRVNVESNGVTFYTETKKLLFLK